MARHLLASGEWHLMHALHRTFPDQPTLVAQLQQALYQGQGERLVRLVQDCRALGVGDPERVARLEGYLRSNRGGFYGARHLREHLSPQARLVAVEGSGAIEKQMDLVVGRRFKGQGMSPEATLAAAGPERGRTGCSNCGYGSWTEPPKGS